MLTFYHFFCKSCVNYEFRTSHPCILFIRGAGLYGSGNIGGKTFVDTSYNLPLFHSLMLAGMDWFLMLLREVNHWWLRRRRPCLGCRSASVVLVCVLRYIRATPVALVYLGQGWVHFLLLFNHTEIHLQCNFESKIIQQVIRRFLLWVFTVNEQSIPCYIIQIGYKWTVCDCGPAFRQAANAPNLFDD